MSRKLKYPKPYSFEWWLALYDCSVQQQWEQYNKILKDCSEKHIRKFTVYSERSRWIRKRLKKSHYNNILIEEFRNKL